MSLSLSIGQLAACSTAAPGVPVGQPVELVAGGPTLCVRDDRGAVTCRFMATPRTFVLDGSFCLRGLNLDSPRISVTLNQVTATVTM